MADVLVDTSVWIDYFRGRASPQTDWLDDALGRLRIGVPDLALAELLQGVTEGQAGRVEGLMVTLEVVTVGGGDMVRLAAANYRRLRGRGLTIRSTIDCLIATFAIENDLPLLHNDRDYEIFERYLGLRSAIGRPVVP